MVQAKCVRSVRRRRQTRSLISPQKLQCHVKFHAIIGAEFEWKSAESLDHVVDMESDTQQRGSRLLGLLSLEPPPITRRTRWFQSDS